MDDYFTNEDLLEELGQYLNPAKQRRPGGITRREIMKKYHVNEKRARDILEKKVDEGILTREVCLLTNGMGGRQFVYYPVDASNE